MSTVQEKLLARLRGRGLDLPEGTRLVRTHASRSAVTAGAWSWFAETADRRPLYRRGGTVGSQYNMTQLVAAADLEISRPDDHGDVNVDPVRPLG